MARIPYADIDSSSEKVRDFFEKIKRSDLEILNVHRMVAHSEVSVREFIRLGSRLLTKPHLSPRLRELVILKIAQLHEARYEWAHHVSIAVQTGVTMEQIKNLKNYGDSACFTGEEKAVLLYTDELFRSHQPSPKTFAETSAFLDHAALVELTLCIGYWSMVAKFLKTFQVDVEEEFERKNAELLHASGSV
ncbi:MAG: carboxymuconolactone decarboxylase family protein [Candidatus Abyssobacteria bacterium SURF_5]|jgi:alkylhydroperoxidase family enzyme|uniref:Carboxymuconolactone decarboxylase family protein n=1 Tax=Abyssobacteria bacterium (strain SURF_5) TaxID=2093360 RepID=A0A3A4P919_ABYX5|nr:MAG: carboxymuconolactone decarboxylase family protein [Candidatus Abyssubacteria bacterium SURF_5]